MVTDEIMTVLEGFHHRIARQIAGTTKGDSGEWEYYLVYMALETTVIWPIKEYVRRRQAKIAEYISGITIYELCTGAELMGGSSRLLRWWDQDHGPNETKRAI